MAIELVILDKKNKDDFILLLEKELCLIFKTSVEDLPDNYGRKYSWSLLSLIESDEIDSYQLLYVDGKFWVGSGGMVREYNQEKIYQACFRAFSKTRGINTGIGSRSYAHEFNTSIQIERARELGCSFVILSFNENNKKLFDITKNFHLRRVFGDVFIPSECPVLFNGVNQWLLMMSLK